MVGAAVAAAAAHPRFGFGFGFGSVTFGLRLTPALIVTPAGVARMG